MARRSEAARLEILDGLEEWKAMRARDSVIKEIPMTPLELERVRPSLIDRISPYLMIGGMILLIAIGTKLSEWVVTI